MKKLMFGLAIAAVGSAFAVESSNIVGYKQEVTLENQDFKQFTPSFVNVAKTSVTKLSDLNFVPSRGDNIQLFDENGNNSKTLEYRRRGKSPNYEFYWVLTDYTDNPDGIETEITDYEFPRGQSFWFATNSEVEFTQSGAVNTNSVVYTIPGDQAFVQAGNPRPTSVKLSEMVFSDLTRGDNIQMFDVAGNNVKTIEYRRRGKSPNYEFYWVETDYSSDPDGVETEIDPSLYEFTSGSSFWFCLKNEGTVTIPGLTL